MDSDRVGQGALIAAGSGVLLIVATFLPWFGIDTGGAVLPDASGADDTLNIWQADGSLDLYLFIVGVVAIVPAMLASSGGGAALAMSPAAAATLLGAVGTVLVFYRVLDVPDGISRKIGLLLGLIAVAGVTIGGYMAMQEEAGEYEERY